MTLDDMVLDLEQSIEVQADLDEAFPVVLYRLGEGQESPNGQPLQLVLEPWAGGRWYRDRGEGVGHLWGHVQAIKSPTLLELCGPLFMSYPVLNHIEVRLERIEDKTRIRLRHRALGLLEKKHRESFSIGWRYIFERIAGDLAASGAAQPPK